MLVASLSKLAGAHRNHSCELPNVTKQLSPLGIPNVGIPNAGPPSKKSASTRANYRVGRRSWLLHVGRGGAHLCAAWTDTGPACTADAGSPGSDQRDN